MTIYEKRRRKSGLQRSEMAYLLDIAYKKYVSIERGKVKMPSKLIDKFNEIINRTQAENTIDRMNKNEKVNSFWESIKENVEVLRNKMEEFNISTYKDLGQLLGYTDGSAISHYLNSAETVPEEFKNILYDFFENELNIQEPKKEEKIKISKEEKHKSINEWLDDKNISIKDFADYSGIPYCTMNRIVNNNQKPRKFNMDKINTAIEQIEKNGNTIPDLTREEKNRKNGIVDKYLTDLENIQDEIDRLTETIELSNRKIDILKEKESIYSEFCGVLLDEFSNR